MKAWKESEMRVPDIVRSPQVEALLEELDLRWHLAQVPLEDIDENASLHNQARLVPLDEVRLDR